MTLKTPNKIAKFINIVSIPLSRLYLLNEYRNLQSQPQFSLRKVQLICHKVRNICNQCFVAFFGEILTRFFFMSLEFPLLPITIR